MDNYMYIAHHGIKGQKWGVRRYQNPDGTLTDAGRKKYTKKAHRAELRGKVHEGNAAKTELFKTQAKYIGAASLGTLGFLVASLAGAPVSVAGAALGAGYVGGKMAYSAMYDRAINHQKRLANVRYAEAVEYRKLLENG